MSLRCPEIFLLALIAAGCEREERPLRVDTPVTDAVRSVELSELIPGMPPTTQPSAGDYQGPVQNDYEHNAYLLSEGQRLYQAFNCNTCHADGGGDIGPALIDVVGRKPAGGR